MDDEDDYWNTSETKAKALSFDDDVLSPQEILAIGKKSTSQGGSEGVINISNVKSLQLPISSLVSPKVLDLIIQAQSGAEPVQKQPTQPSDTVATSIKRLVLGRSRCLHNLHRSLQAKRQLLAAATATQDGDSLLAIILFLIQTLNKKLAYELLSSRPLALRHYIGFLQSEGKISELTDLLTMLGRSPEAAMYQYQHHVKGHSSAEGLLRKLNNLLSNHFDQPGVDAHSVKMLANYIKFLEWQKCVNNEQLMNKSVITCLSHCVNKHWPEGAGNMMSPLTLCQQQQISPQQYDWVVLNVHARLKNWDIVESIFTRKDWLGRATLASHAPLHLVIAKLSELGAEKRLLANFINKIQNTDERLQLAMQFKVHSVVIETYAKQKDRIALIDYKSSINAHSEESILAENTLRNAIFMNTGLLRCIRRTDSEKSIKWKN